MFPLTSSRENRTLGKTKLTGFPRNLTWSVFKGRLSLIVRVNVVLNRTVVVDSDSRFDNLCGSHLQSQSELYHVSWWYYTLVIDLIGQLHRDVIGRLSVKLWCYWRKVWHLVKEDFYWNFFILLWDIALVWVWFEWSIIPLHKLGVKVVCCP